MANEVIPESLRRRYIDSFPGKCAAFDAVIESLNGADTDDAVGFAAKLRDLAHKLAGSAGMYGFDDLGHLAREIVHAIDAGAGAPALGGLAQNLMERLAGTHAALEI